MLQLIRPRDVATRRRRALYLTCAVGIGVYGLLTAQHYEDGVFWTAFENITEVLAALAATVACVVRARRERAARASSGNRHPRSWMAWSLIVAGLGAWAIGQIGWSVIVVGFHSNPPEVSPLDGAFLLSPVLIVAGLLAMVGTPAGYLSNLRGALEGSFIAASVCLLSWVLIVGEVSEYSTTSKLAQIVNFAYPLLDVVAIAAVLFVACWRSEDAPRGLGLLGVGIAFVALADSSFWYMDSVNAHFQGSTSLDAGWVAGFALIAFGALRFTDTENGRRKTLSRHALLAIPALPAVLAVVAMLIRWALGNGLGTSPATLMVILGIVVLLGAILLLTVGYENDTLRRGLEQRVADRTAELDATERYYHALVQHASDVVMVVGTDLRLRYLSDSLLEIFGFAPNELDWR